MKEDLEQVIEEVELHYCDSENNRVSKAIGKAKEILASPKFID